MIHFRPLPAPLDTLSAAECQILAPYLEKVTFAEGRCLFRVGTLGDSCYLIDTGTVRIELPNEDGSLASDDIVLGFLGPGSILGELSVLDQLPRSCAAPRSKPARTTTAWPICSCHRPTCSSRSWSRGH